MPPPPDPAGSPPWPRPRAGYRSRSGSPLIAAVDALDERERIIVLGIFGAGLSQAEMAATRALQSQVFELLGRALGKLSEKVAYASLDTTSAFICGHFGPTTST